MTTPSAYQRDLDRDSDTDEFRNADLPIRKAPVLYRRRWVMLLMFALVGLSNSAIQFTFASIARTAMVYYGNMEPWKINMMAITYQTHILLAAPVAAVFMARCGLRPSVVTSSLLQTAGCLVRLAAIIPQESFFWVAFVGQTICAISSPFQINGATTMASNWFGVKERAVATTVGSFSSILGTGVAFGLCPLIVRNGTIMSMSILFGLQFAIAATLFVSNAVFLRTRPPTPPSYGQYEEEDNDEYPSNEEQVSLIGSQNKKGEDTESATVSKVAEFLESIGPLLNKNLLILVMAFMLGFGTINAFLNLVNQVTAFQGYSTLDASLFGMIVIFMGLFGAIMNGIAADLTKRYHLLLIICGGMALLAYGSVTALLMFKKTWVTATLLYISMAFVGIFGVAIVPVTFELAVELSYPAPPSYSNTIANACGNIFTVFIVAAMTALELPHKPGEFGDMSRALLFSLIMFTLAILLMLFLRGEYRRLAHERENQERRVARDGRVPKEKKKEEEKYGATLKSKNPTSAAVLS